MNNILIILIKSYQKIISPYFLPCCRYHPSCSQYALQAIQLHGTSKGLYLSFRRFLRCHPFHEGGIDPVPEPENQS